MNPAIVPSPDGEAGAVASSTPPAGVAIPRNVIGDPTADSRLSIATVTPIAGISLIPILIPYASHFSLLHHVSESSIELLQDSFPERLVREQDMPALLSFSHDGDGVLSAFETAGYISPAAGLSGVNGPTWEVRSALRPMLNQELSRYLAAFARSEGMETPATFAELIRVAHSRLADVLDTKSSDSREGEHWFGELAVQLRRAERWGCLEQLWYRLNLRLLVLHPAESFEAFSSIPEAVLNSHAGLRFAHTYIASTSVMLRTAPAESNDDVNMLVSRLSVQVTELTAVVGPQWRHLETANASVHVGLNWMRYLRLRGDFASALDVNAELKKYVSFEVPRGQRVSDRNLAFLKLEQGILFFFLERFSEALESLGECILLWQRPATGDYIPAFAFSLRSLIYALMGEPASARDCLNQAHNIFGEVTDYNYVSVLTLTVESMLAFDRLEIDRASASIGQLDSLAPESELWAIAAATAQRVDLAVGAIDAAMSRLDSLSETGAGAARLSLFSKNVYSSARMDSLQSVGNSQLARDFARRAGVQSGASRVSEARMYLTAGRTEHALNLTKSAQNDERLLRPDRAGLRLLEAVAHLRLGQESHGQAALDRALHRMIALRSLQPFSVLTSRMRAELLGCAATPALWKDLGRALELSEAEVRARIAALADVYPEQALLVDLTPRESQLLRALSEGVTQAEIANRSSLSLSAVKKQFASLYKKLGAESKTEALRVGHELRLL